jgi:hypothetical protein
VPALPPNLISAKSLANNVTDPLAIKGIPLVALGLVGAM